MPVKNDPIHYNKACFLRDGELFYVQDLAEKLIEQRNRPPVHCYFKVMGSTISYVMLYENNNRGKTVYDDIQFTLQEYNRGLARRDNENG